MKRFLFLLLATLALSASYAQRASVQMQNTQARKLDLQSNAYVKPLTVELQLNEELGKISDTWRLTKDQAEISLSGDLNNIRNYALFLTTKKHSADVIVAALINVMTSEDGYGYDVTVEGFPANYVNWKIADESDLEWIKADNLASSPIISK